MLPKVIQTQSTKKPTIPHPFEGLSLLYGLVEGKSAGGMVHLKDLPTKAILASHSNTKIVFLFLEKLS